MITSRSVTLPLPSGLTQKIADDIVVIHSSLGPDFIRLCTTHKWGSHESVYRRDLPDCPHCAAEEDREGRQRYEDVERRLLEQLVTGVQP